MAEISGGEVIARMLQEEGVEKVFGIIDGTYFGFYSALHRLGIEIVTPRHETSAAHMAGAYARLTGKLGVCMASNGPGVANILPGLVVEQAEGNRVLVITSARRPSIMYPDRGGTYQCFDQVGVIGKIAKWSEAVSSFERIPELVRKALRKSYEGRPGVVHVDVPENIMNGKVKAEVAIWAPHQYRQTDPLRRRPSRWRAAAEMLIAAAAPMIHAGSGIIHAHAFARCARVAELLHAPVTTSWAARGVLPETSPLAMPMPHVKLNHKVRNDADVVLVIGSRARRNRLVGQAAVLAASVRAADDPGRHRRRHARPQQAGRPRHPRRRAALPRAARRRTGAAQGRNPARGRRARVAGYAKTMTRRPRGLGQGARRHGGADEPGAHGAVCREVFAEDAVLVADGGNATIWAMFYPPGARAEHACCRPSSSACSAPAWRRRSAPRWRGRASRCAASSATARWASIRRRSRPRCATRRR